MRLFRLVATEKSNFTGCKRTIAAIRQVAKGKRSYADALQLQNMQTGVVGKQADLVLFALGYCNFKTVSADLDDFFGDNKGIFYKNAAA